MRVAKLLEYALPGKPKPLCCPKSDGFLRSYLRLNGLFLGRSFGLLLFDRLAFPATRHCLIIQVGITR